MGALQGRGGRDGFRHEGLHLFELLDTDGIVETLELSSGVPDAPRQLRMLSEPAVELVSGPAGERVLPSAGTADEVVTVST